MKATARRLLALEAHHSPPKPSTVVSIPWRDWPESEKAWEAVRTAHPEGRLFIPSVMSEAEWESTVPAAQALR